MSKKEFNELDFIVNYVPYRAALILVFVLGYFMVFDNKWDVNGDNAAYYNLGTALSEGLGFVNPALPGTPPETHFPIGYPTFIAALKTVGIQGAAGLKMANGFLLLITGLLWFELFQKLIPRKNLAFVAVLAMFVSPLLMRFSTIIMSEILFLFLSTATLFSLSKKGNNLQNALASPYFYTACIAAVAGFYVKTLGFIILGTIPLFYLWSKNIKAAAAGILPGLLAVFPYLSGSTGGGNYLHQLIMVNPYQPEKGLLGAGDVVERLSSNAFNYGFGVIQSVAFPLSNKWLGSFLFLDVIFGGLVLYFIYLGLKKITGFKKLILPFLGLTVPVILLWPDVWTGPRFIVHAAPLFIFIFLAGLLTWVEKYEHKFSTKKPAGVFPLFLFTLLSIIALNTERLKAQADYPLNWKKYFDTAGEAQRTTPQDAVFIARKPHLFYVHSGRQAANFKNTENDTLQMDYFMEIGATHVVLDNLGYGSTPRYLFPTLEKHAICFKNVMSFPEQHTYLLSFDRALYGSDQYEEKLKTQRDSLLNQKDAELQDDFLVD